VLVSPLGAQAQPWTFAVTPYLWLPNVDGTLKYSAPPGTGSGPGVRVGPNDYLENLDLALMLAGEARKGHWSFVADLVYLDFASERSSANGNIDAKSSLKGLQWTLAGGTTVIRTPSLLLDVLGGLRYLGIEATTDLTAGSVSERTELWDAIVGVRGRVQLGESRWFMPYHLDIGGGSSRLTWQGMLGIAYAFKWGDAILAYRHLSYDQSGDGLYQDFRFSGPAAGATFRF
jgi:hypothetical protein